MKKYPRKIRMSIIRWKNRVRKRKLMQLEKSVFNSANKIINDLEKSSGFKIND